MSRGEFLSDKCAEKGLSVSDLAEKLGVSVFEAERWEKGELPDSEYLLRLSALLDVSVEDILRGGESKVGQDCTDLQDNSADKETAESSCAEETENKESEKKEIAVTNNAEVVAIGSQQAGSATSVKDNTSGASGRNGYTSFERKFGYAVFIIFIVAVIVLSSVQFVSGGFSSELTLKNYDRYIEIRVTPVSKFNNDEFTVSIKSDRNIRDLRISLRVKFSCFYGDDITESIVISGNIDKGGTIERTMHISEYAYNASFEVVSVEGGIV